MKHVFKRTKGKILCFATKSGRTRQCPVLWRQKSDRKIHQNELCFHFIWMEACLSDNACHLDDQLNESEAGY